MDQCGEALKRSQEENEEEKTANEKIRTELETRLREGEEEAKRLREESDGLARQLEKLKVPRLF